LENELRRDVLQKIHAIIVIVSCLSLPLAVTSFAQATRTWVSGVGDDANPGSVHR
jgi:hypothetical protein